MQKNRRNCKHSFHFPFRTQYRFSFGQNHVFFSKEQDENRSKKENNDNDDNTPFIFLSYCFFMQLIHFQKNILHKNKKYITRKRRISLSLSVFVCFAIFRIHSSRFVLNIIIVIVITIVSSFHVYVLIYVYIPILILRLICYFSLSFIFILPLSISCFFSPSLFSNHIILYIHTYFVLPSFIIKSKKKSHTNTHTHTLKNTQVSNKAITNTQKTRVITKPLDALHKSKVTRKWIFFEEMCNLFSFLFPFPCTTFYIVYCTEHCTVSVCSFPKIRAAEAEKYI